jgi:hypothetical protein
VAVGIAFLSAPASLLISALVAGYYVFEHTPSLNPGAITTSDRYYDRDGE